jgi:hypothetical protein
MKPRKDSTDKGAGSGCMARLVRFLDSWGDIISIILALIVWLIVALFVLLLCRELVCTCKQEIGNHRLNNCATSADFEEYS